VRPELRNTPMKRTRPISNTESIEDLRSFYAGSNVGSAATKPGRTSRGGAFSFASFTLGLRGSASGGAPKERATCSAGGAP
jgi:hypothetical protein